MKVAHRILGVTLATAAGLAPLPFAARRTAATAPQRMVTVTGTLDRWNLAVDGRVYLRLQAEHAVEENGDGADVPPGGMWFYTPPDRSDDLQLEQMVLGIALASELQPERRVLTVTAKEERALDGSEPEKALPLESIGRP